MTYNVERFVVAQKGSGFTDSYEHALAQIQRGRKVTHWIWYVFPQLTALGKSNIAREYGISGLQEATDYLAHPVLGRRLVEISRALLELETRDAVAVLGHIDAVKLRSSMTLFSLVEGADPVFQQVLDEYFDGEVDALTVQLLK